VTPIGINLPNDQRIREQYGSKSVALSNVNEAYSKSTPGTMRSEFSWSPEEAQRAAKWAEFASELTTDMHEVIGHASGQLREGVQGEELKNYSSTLEEARADLVALYYLLDPKLVELGVMPDLEVGRAAYDRYVRNALVGQLARLEPGEDLEEAHMRNRQMIAKWAFEQGKDKKVIERVERDGKTYFVINDYEALRVLFGKLLSEVQRIKSEGDFAAGKALVEAHGVKVDKELHAQVRERYAALKIAPYAGFIQPRLVPVMEGEAIVDVRVEYPTDFAEQMIEFGTQYSFLPTVN
jgi:dipeptidyl-peptidase-3